MNAGSTGQSEQVGRRRVIIGEWLTYQQAGERLGITSEAARQRAKRLRWRHRRGNEGKALIQLPDKPDDQATGQTPVQPVALSDWDNGGEVLRELVHVLRDQLAKAEERERDARQQAREERERSAAAEVRAGDAVHQLRAEQDRAAAAEQHAGELRRLLDDELAALRADLARATVRAVAGPDEGRTTAIRRRPLSRWFWGFARKSGR